MRDEHGLRFDGLGTRVVVPPSPTLTQPGGLRAHALFLLDDLHHRRTLIEGYLAFSLLVRRDGTLAGGLYIGGEWHLIESAAGAIEPGRWTSAALTYDGRATIVLTIDGEITASHIRALGPAGAVAWPFGLNVGAWPDADLRMFRGTMREATLWRHLPASWQLASG
jgi:hypothetical protein